MSSTMNASSPSDGSSGAAGESARIHLLVEPGGVRRRLLDLLGGEYEVTHGTPTPERVADRSFDACIVDGPNLRRRRSTLDRWRSRADPVFLPVLLVDTAGDGLGSEPWVWGHVDDVVRAPLGATELRARLSGLLERRRTSSLLAERERALERATAELDLKERALDAAPSGVTITDPDGPDNPTVYASEAFERITGYDPEEVLGRNMRFLQGEATDPAAVSALREGIDAGERVSATLLNYRADGTRFWNRVDVAPVRDEDGRVTNYVGFQTDVTDERIREQRLSVLNRVMRHNLANSLNVVTGDADLLLEELEDPERLAAVSRIEDAAERLLELGEDARRIERVLHRCRAVERRTDVVEELVDATEAVERAHPEAHVSLDAGGGPWHVDGGGLDVAFRELLENAAEHGAGPEPVVSVSVAPAADPPDRIEVRIADDGAGIPDGIVEMLRAGRETQLNHGDGVGLWLVHWIVTLLGGDVGISTPEEGGTVVRVTLPVGEGSDA